MEQLTSTESSASSKSQVSGMLPLNDWGNVLKFETLVDSDDDVRKSSMQYLTKIGGQNAKEATIRTLTRLFSLDIAAQCSWMGQKNNHRISSLKLIQIIKDCVLENYSTTDKEIEDVGMEWFRQAKQKLKRKQSERLQQSSAK